jgi:PAS domain S-box-containing protein
MKIMEAGMAQRKLSTLTTLVLILAVVVGATSALFTALLVHYRTDDLIDRADARLLEAAEFSRAMLGPDYHDRIVDETSVSKEQFRHIVAANDDLCRRMGLQYLWSVLLVDNRLVFSSATHSILTDPNSPCATFFETHRDPEAFSPALPPEGKTSFSSFKNEWGQGRMVLLPGKDARGRTYIFGASVQLTELNAMVRWTVLTSIGIGLAVFIGTFVLSLVLVRSFTAPITTLSEAAGRMATGDLDAPLAPAGTREVHSLGNSLDRMRQGLQRQVKELRTSEQRFRQIVDRMPVMMDAFDETGNLVAWNEECERVTGYKATEMLGNADALTLIYPNEEYRQSVIASIRKPAGDFRNVEFDVTRKDGTTRSISWSNISDSVPVPGWFTWAIGIDITELKRTYDFLENLLNYANAPIIVWDAQFKITHFNRAFERLTGRKSGDVLGLGLDFLFPPEKRTESPEYIQSTSIGERWETVEIPIQHVDGSVRTLLWNSATLYGTDGKTVVATIAQGNDITEGRQAQEEQRKLEAQLAQAQKMEAVGTLAGGIAHDFNNILGIIMGHAELAELHLVKDSPAKRYIDEVLKAAYRAKDLVKQILTFSRKGEQERKPMQLIPITKEALKFLRASLPMTIEICQEINLSQADDLILGDPTQVQQILMNLSTNAAHAMRERGGTLRVALSSVHFGPSDAGKPAELGLGKYLKLTVEDSGHGMDWTTINHIFDPFFTTKGPGEGTGLGLAVVHGVITSHGGAITVSSRVGKGTAFHVYLPRLETGETAKTEVVSELPKGSERILLVDDEEPLANAVKQLLEYLGYKVTVTTSSAEALLAFRQQPEDFDLVITDYTMPKMTGTDLADQIVQIRPGIPIILCTGFNEKISEEGTRKVGGICALMMKPGSLRDIALLIRKVLKTKES